MIHPIYQIQEVTFTGVGNTFVELPLEPCPFKGKISRVRAIVTAGTVDDATADHTVEFQVTFENLV